MKDLFPIYKTHKDLVYLDSAASSLKPQVVIDAINDYYNNYSCNIERGVYKIGYDATAKVDLARKTIADYFNVKSNEIIFTRGATSSLNMAIKMVMSTLSDGDEVITSLLEHHSSLLPILNEQKHRNIIVKYIPLDENGMITVENFKKVLSPKTKFVELTHVSNVLGYVTPIREIIKIAHERGILVSVDGAQSAPHMAIDLKDLDADFYSFSFHKMFGPTGLGVLYSKKELLRKFDSIEVGGEMNDEVSTTSFSYKDIPYKHEAGTIPIAEVFGAKAAIDFIKKIGIDKIEEHSLTLRNKALEELKKIKEIEIYNANVDSSIIAFKTFGFVPLVSSLIM